MANSFLEDSQGNKSSKRIAGSILIGLGIIGAITLYIFSLFFGAKDSSTAMDIVQLFILSGSGLIGAGTFENGLFNNHKY